MLYPPAPSFLVCAPWHLCKGCVSFVCVAGLSFEGSTEMMHSFFPLLPPHSKVPLSPMGAQEEEEREGVQPLMHEETRRNYSVWMFGSQREKVHVCVGGGGWQCGYGIQTQKLPRVQKVEKDP